MDEHDVNLVPFDMAWDELLYCTGYNVPAICLEDSLFLSDEDRQEHMRWPEHVRYGRPGPVYSGSVFVGDEYA